MIGMPGQLMIGSAEGAGVRMHSSGSEIAQVRQEIKALEKSILGLLDAAAKTRSSEENRIEIKIPKLKEDLEKKIGSLDRLVREIEGKLREEIRILRTDTLKRFSEVDERTDRGFNDLEAARKRGDGDLGARIESLTPQRHGLTLSADDSEFLQQQFAQLEARLTSRFETRIQALESENLRLRALLTGSRDSASAGVGDLGDASETSAPAGVASAFLPKTSGADVDQSQEPKT